jgi:hypothetical protein
MRTLPALVPCPDCGSPAQIGDRFSLVSTDGPVPHVAVSCVAGHNFRMPQEMLPNQRHDQAGPAARIPEPAARVVWPGR